MMNSQQVQSSPKRIANYLLSHEKIGEGSFGSVFLGYDTTNNNHTVAIKVINRAKLTGRNAQYLMNEVVALKNCRNQHVVRLYDIKKTRHNFYLILQHCDGGDLYQYIAKKGSLPEEQALKLFYQILAAFKTIVKLGLIHRDLKPQNIFLKDGKVKIGDFGLSKILTKKQLTKTYAGSPLNMAPQILKHQAYDNRADIYSIGTVLYQMLFGCLPFTGNNTQDLITQITSLKGPDLSTKVVSKDTQKLLKGMLQPDVNQRLSWDQLFSHEGKMMLQANSQLFQQYEKLMGRVKLTWMGVLPSIASILTEGLSSQSSVKNNKKPPLIDVQLAAGLLSQLIKGTTFAEE